MSKVKIQGNASGTGVLTVTAPNTSTDRTITLPDGTGTLIADNGSGQVGIGTTTHHDATTKLTVAGRINTSNGTATGSMNYGGGAVVNMGALTNHPVNLMVNNSTKWVIDTSGNLIAEGGGGIVLGNTSYAAANELDDYEEGDWTPVVHDVSNNLATMHSLTAGKYTKIGRVVTIVGEMLVNSVSSPIGGVRVSLPFAIAAHSADRNMTTMTRPGMYHVPHTQDNPPLFMIPAGQNVIEGVYERDDASFLDYNVQGGEAIYFGFSYLTD